MKTAIAIIIIFASFATASFAQQAGDLDSTFGVNGIVVTDFDSAIERAFKVLIQPDGKIIVAGTSWNNDTSSYYDFVALRYNIDGSLDTAFGTKGKASINVGPYGDLLNSAALQPDGKIVLVGTEVLHFNLSGDFAAVRLNEDGSLDSSFGGDGIVTTDFMRDYCYSVALTAEGKILLGGYSENPNPLYETYFTLVQYNSDGSLDENFGTGGLVTTDFDSYVEGLYAIAIQGDGNIVAAGITLKNNSGLTRDWPLFTVARYNTNGTLDFSFSQDGKATAFRDTIENECNALAIQPDGNIVIAGYSTDTLGKIDYILFRFNADGSLDSTFGSDGCVVTDIGGSTDVISSVVLIPDGRITASGYSYSINDSGWDASLSMYKTNGDLDSSFGVNGMSILDNDFNWFSNSSAMQADSKIVLAGTSANLDFVVARCLSGLNVGIVEFSESENNVLIYPNPIGETATLEYTLTQPETITIRLLDMQGKTIKTFLSNTQREAGSHQQAITLPATLPAGSYLIVIESEKGRMGIKVFKV